MKTKILAVALSLSLLLLTACSTAPTDTSSMADDTAKDADMMQFTSFEDAVEKGSSSEVNIFMWGGNESINTYIDEFVAKDLKEMYDITLNRVPMNAEDFVAKVLNEKKNNTKNGSIDVLWINAENFKTLKEAEALYGPFTDLLPNLETYYSEDLADIYYDSGYAIDGYEAIWGSAQLVFTFDDVKTPNPPQSYAEFLSYSMDHKGRLTYPNPLTDFVGSAFVRNAYFELTDIDFSQEMTKEEFITASKPVIDYFKALNANLWNDGEVFPQNIAMQDSMFINGETDITMGFEVFKTAGEVIKNIFPASSKSYVLDGGTMGNSHYLAIPYNAQQKAGALLVIDYLQSPKAQIEKLKPEVWGDLTPIDITKLSEADNAMVKDILSNEAIIPLDELLSKRIGDTDVIYIDWIEEIWETMILEN